MGGPSVLAAGPFACVLPACAEAVDLFSAEGLAAASFGSIAEVSCSASRIIGANASGRLGGQEGARPIRFAAAGARRWPAQVCSSRRFQPILWPSGSSAIPSANLAAAAPACSSCTPDSSSWIRTCPTTDAPAWTARANAPAASVICAGSPSSCSAGGRPDSTSQRDALPRRGSVTRSPAPMNRWATNEGSMPASSRHRVAASRELFGTRRSHATSSNTAPASPCSASSLCSAGDAEREFASAANAPASR